MEILRAWVVGARLKNSIEKARRLPLAFSFRQWLNDFIAVLASVVACSSEALTASAFISADNLNVPAIFIVFGRYDLDLCGTAAPRASYHFITLFFLLAWLCRIAHNHSLKSQVDLSKFIILTSWYYYSIKGHCCQSFYSKYSLS